MHPLITKLWKIENYTLVRIACILQLLAFLSLGISTIFRDSEQHPTIDAVWYYFIQIPYALMMVVGPIYVQSDVNRARMTLTYICLNMFFGILSAGFFTVFSNSNEIQGRRCDQVANLTEINDGILASGSNETLLTIDPQLIALCNEQPYSLLAVIRTAVYLVLQVVCVHPAINYVIELWSNNVNSINNSKAS